jgi:hypothetical protein
MLHSHKVGLLAFLLCLLFTIYSVVIIISKFMEGSKFLEVLSMLAFKHGRLQCVSFKSDLWFLAMYFPLLLLSQGSCSVQKDTVLLAVGCGKILMMLLFSD